MAETRDFLDNEIYPRLDRAQLVASLDPKDRGAYWALRCPQCGQSEAYLYKKGVHIACNRRNECGYSSTLWDFVQDAGALSQQDTLRELARMAGVDLQEHVLDPADREREDTLDAALVFFQEQLWIAAGKATLDYLHGRGYSDAEIKHMGLGHFPGQHASTQYASVLRWAEWRKEHTLVIPYRDPAGRIKGLWSRLTRHLSGEEKEADKYKPLADAEGIKAVPFNMDRARGISRPILVEGYLDALIAAARGVRGVVALGGASLMEAQAKALKKYGARGAVLCLDADSAGAKGTDAAIGTLWEHGLRVFVVTLPDGEDVDSYLHSHTPDDLQVLIDKAEAGATWKAKRLLTEHPVQEAQGREDALHEALSINTTLQDPLDSRDFLGAVTAGLGLTLEDIAQRVQEYRETEKRRQLRESYRNLSRDITRALEDGREANLESIIGDTLKAVRSGTLTAPIEPYTVKDLETDIRRGKPGLKTGYWQLDEIIRIPQEAITIVAGRPSHGKTTLLLNLFLNMVKADADRAFFFFSYEETRKQLALKLVNILSGDVIDETRNLASIEGYLRPENRDHKRDSIERGKAVLGGYVSGGRLWLIDEPYSVEGLRDVLEHLASRHDVGAVFVDYIQKVKIGGRYATRQMELQKISEQFLEAAKGLRIPIILGAQLGRDKDRKNKVRLDNLREAGDIEQDANLVLGLHNAAMEKAVNDGEALRTPEVDLSVTILKNRNGPVNDEIMLRFNRPLLTITDLRPPPKDGEVPF